MKKVFVCQVDVCAKNEARQLFALFLKKQSEFKMDEVDKSLLDYEATDIEHALSHAKREA
jgi:hypothetical protein